MLLKSTFGVVERSIFTFLKSEWVNRMMLNYGQLIRQSIKSDELSF